MCLLFLFFTMKFMSENFESTYENSIPNQDFWENDGISLTGNPYYSSDSIVFTGSHLPGGLGEDHISFNTSPTFSVKVSDNNFWKFGENKTLKAVEDYIKSTYNSHYASENSKVQVLDIIDAIGDGVPFCRDNLIKYSSRFGKKDGMSKLDALKIIHYGILLYNFAGFNNETAKSNYETF
jgi:Protein of unknwon function (DUF3310)